jgi:hypothetical protein
MGCRSVAVQAGFLVLACRNAICSSGKSSVGGDLRSFFVIAVACEAAWFFQTASLLLAHDPLIVDET